MSKTPYLSVVVAARNDNHGGNMLRRMQIFVNGVLEQCRRYQLDAELIIVEWNPPTDNPPLAEALSWNISDSPCTVRIIEVSSEIHQRLNYSQSLPLFQMIAKNVGIRRAKGEFVLATNIDLLFSDELFSFLASRQMKVGKIYRLDRYDVRSEVPLEASLEQQLEYCQHSIIRICGKNGIEELTLIPPPEEEPKQEELATAIEIAPTQLQPKWYRKIPQPAISRLALAKQLYRRLLPTEVRDSILRMLPKDFTSWLIEQNLLTVQPLPPPPALEELEPPQEEPPAPPLWQYPQLHTNACGDFTLMSRMDWFAIRGYPEWEIFSFHLDSVLMYVAHYAGIEEKILEDPMRMYHIEHASGWTPDTERTQTLNRRLASLKIPQLSFEQFDALVKLMHQLNKPIIFNDENWGMVQETLEETTHQNLDQLLPSKQG
jgi:hypothetical protein